MAAAPMVEDRFSIRQLVQVIFGDGEFAPSQSEGTAA